MAFKYILLVRPYYSRILFTVGRTEVPSEQSIKALINCYLHFPYGKLYPKLNAFLSHLKSLVLSNKMSANKVKYILCKKKITKTSFQYFCIFYFHSFLLIFFHILFLTCFAFGQLKYCHNLSSRLYTMEMIYACQ